MLPSAKSMGADQDEAARLRVLRDPKRMASLLVRAFSSTTVLQASQLRDSTALERTATAADLLDREEEDDEEVEEKQEEMADDAKARRTSSAASGECSGADAGVDGPLHVAVRPALDDDDDADEEDEDDEDDEDDDLANSLSGRPLDEEELEAAATALQAAMRIVEELRLKMLLKAGQQQDDDVNGNEEPASSVGSNAGVSQLSEGAALRRGSNAPGVPCVHARVRSDSSCQSCGKSFHPFHRSKNCTTCGFAFCPKCSSKQQVLPTCFGFQDEPMRTCDLCSTWFQKALDQYFDAMDIAKLPNQPHAVHHGSTGEITIEEQPSPPPQPSASEPSTSQQESLASPNIEEDGGDDGEGEADEGKENDERDIVLSTPTPTMARRRRRHSSISSSTGQPSSASSTPKTRPWFSGHLRAMHVSDRLPRKKKRGEGEMEGSAVDATSPELRYTGGRRDRAGSGMSSCSKAESTYEDGVEGKAHELQDSSDQVMLVNGNRRGSLELPTTRVPPRIVTGSSLNISFPKNSSPSANSDGPGSSDVAAQSSQAKKRRAKFSRSASFDLTNLHSAAKSPASPSLGPSNVKRSHTFIAQTALSGGSIATAVASSNGVLKSFPSKKCFDDSDIVDARTKPDSVEGKLKSAVELPAAVLRFAVYEMGAKETGGLRRTLGFAKANPVLDRYTLELDCRQRIVRAKSVFMHRFWSFHCDSVQSFVFGSSEGMARLIVFNGGQGNQSLELKFANDEEREQFKQAMDSCQSNNLDRMRGFAARGGAMSLPARVSIPLSPVPTDEQTPTLKGSSGELSMNLLGEPALSMSADGSSNDAIESPMVPLMPLPLLPGEVAVKDTELPATLLIGPAGETFESTLVWGRLRGMIAVTNYRVIFLPFDRVQLQLRANGQGGIAYIPLFAITQVQILYPGGRRTKSGRTYYAGMAGSASIISISCKDIRVLRFQLDTPPTLSDDHTKKLRSVIAKMADACQRYSVVARTQESPSTTASSPGLDPLPEGGSSNAPLPDTDETNGGTSDISLQESQEPAFLSIHLTNNPRSPNGPVSFASPVLRPDRSSSIPRELCGTFALSYALDNVPADQNGWNIFVDEREFKRQIGGDSAVSPFLKFYQNAKGNICRTYPSKLLLPASMNSATLVKVADFRAKNRIPVITYYHRRNRCVLTRSSQPLLGNLLSGSSNISDQLLVGVYRRLPDIIKNQSQSSASSRPIYIFDARKPKASTGNRLMGKGGVETPQDYPGAVIHHLNIANMYRMQSSFMGLMKLLLPGGTEDNDRAWLSSVESTRWLDHVRLVLEGALKIARVLELEGASVLVHCSDGWDRTAQLCALAQLMIDPYFRTIRGFAVLVEKDWCAFGHKFSERTGGDRNRDPQRNKSSPIMFQFIDAVWQIHRQHPHSFEFNERFLLHLANSMTSGLYGTFLYDSRLQRDVNEVENTSVSVWTPVLMTPSLFTNDDYVPYDGPIWPWASCKMVRLWDNYFFQWHPKFYNCQWVCSLVHHGPSRARESSGGNAIGDNDSVNDEDQQQASLRESMRVRDPPVLDLQATPITSTITEGDDEDDVPLMDLSLGSMEDGGVSTFRRGRTSSGSHTRTQGRNSTTQKSSKRNIFQFNKN